VFLKVLLRLGSLKARLSLAQGSLKGLKALLRLN